MHGELFVTPIYSRTMYKVRPDHGTTGRKLSNVKVNRKGQVTIPLQLRERFKIEGGSVLKVEEREQGTMLKPAAPLEAGEVVGENAYERILRDLESLRKKWR